MRSDVDTSQFGLAGCVEGSPSACTSTEHSRGLLIATAATLCLCLVFGGATQAGTLPDALLQLAAIPLLVVAASGLTAGPPAWRVAFLAGLALGLVPLLQLVPLPPAIWTALPHRDLVVEALTLAGEPLGWRPLSLTPHQTWLSFAALIPPLAVFFAAVQMSAPDRRVLAAAVVVWAVVSSLLGLMQVSLAAGEGLSILRLSSDGEATGFFANRNHFAASLYCALLIAACFLVDRLRTLAPGPQMLRAPHDVAIAILLALCLLILLAGEIMARSRGGIALTMVALLAIAILAATQESHRSRSVGRLFALAVGLVLVCAAQLALYRLFQRFEADPFQDARLVIARNTWDAVLSHFPWGSGLGSFIPVYQTFETATDALVDRYANRAHNDVLELLLETGVLGLAGMVLFAAWSAAAIRRVWRRDRKDAPAASPLDRLLMRAASLAIVLLIAHSLVDYPLRTSAMACVFAFCCALLIPAPEQRAQPARIEPPRSGRGRSEPSCKADRAPPAPFVPWPQSQHPPQTPRATDQRPPPEPPNPGSTPTSGKHRLWGRDVQWPDAWSEGAQSRPGSADQTRPGSGRPR